MKIWQYLGITPIRFQTEYVETGLVDVSDHDTYPLRMLTYGRECVHGTDKWDGVTTKCRGVIYRTDTEEIIARPFEKFHNLYTASMPETDPSTWEPNENSWWQTPTPEVWEKMDGFLATLYEVGREAVHRLERDRFIRLMRSGRPLGYGPVAASSIQRATLRRLKESLQTSVIVVDYGKSEELVLLALVKNETGEEAHRLCTVQYVPG